MSPENFPNFHPNPNRPFPLNLSPEWKSVIVIVLVIVFVIGTILRTIIFKYLRQPESKQYPINALLILDQVASLGYFIFH
jgi:di/tricarboxylate transporter